MFFLSLIRHVNKSINFNIYKNNFLIPNRSFSLTKYFLNELNEEETDSSEPQKEYTKDGAVIVKNTAFTLEWILSSPPPLHAFEESPTLILRPDQEE